MEMRILLEILSGLKTLKLALLTKCKIWQRSDRMRVIEQAKFTYSPLGKAVEKQAKSIEDRRVKQMKAIENRVQKQPFKRFFN